jgi:thymidylate synthase
MITWTAPSFNTLYPRVIHHVMEHGIKSAPRGKPTRELLGATVELTEPRERVLTTPGRRPNPFFQWAETVWILHGSRDIGWIAWFNEQMRNFLDPDGTPWGVYGYRMRYAAGRDQFMAVVRTLLADPDSRRPLISLWHPNMDTEDGHNDLPCNTEVLFKLREGRLHATVINRSNDLHLGLAFTNIAQFTTIQECLAAVLGAELGLYRHYSDSLHIYESAPETERVMKAVQESTDGRMFNVYDYVGPTRIDYPALLSPPERLTGLYGDVAVLYRLVDVLRFDSLLPDVLWEYWDRERPSILSSYWAACGWAMLAWWHLKNDRESSAAECLQEALPYCPDWFVSCTDFLVRRLESRNKDAVAIRRAQADTLATALFLDKRAQRAIESYWRTH